MTYIIEDTTKELSSEGTSESSDKSSDKSGDKFSDKRSDAEHWDEKMSFLKVRYLVLYQKSVCTSSWDAHCQ